MAAFYAGKTVQMMVGTSPGGGVDLIGRLVARHLQNHIPGKPTIVVQNVPGAGGNQMANHLFASGARDGTVIGAPLNGMPTGPLLTPKVSRFDPTQFTWIGSMYRVQQRRLCLAQVAGAEPGGAEDQGGDHRHVGAGLRLVRSVDPVARRARTEVSDRARLQELAPKSTSPWSAARFMPRSSAGTRIKAQRPEWIRDKIITIIGHFSLEDPPDLRPFARIVDLARTEADRQALRLVLARQAHGRPYFLPPGVPAARLTALRRAFDATMRDPAFIAEAAAMKVEVDPMTGEAVQALVEQVHPNDPRRRGRTGANDDGDAVRRRQ